jgi:hypothetical protein
VSIANADGENLFSEKKKKKKLNGRPPRAIFTRTKSNSSKMSAPNKATEMITEIATAWWADTDVTADELTIEDIENALYENAHDILGCEQPAQSADEPFPEWTTLVITKNIANTIDYNWVLERVRESLTTNEDNESVHTTCCMDCDESFEFEEPVPAVYYHQGRHEMRCPKCRDGAPEKFAK